MRVLAIVHFCSVRECCTLAVTLHECCIGLELRFSLIAVSAECCCTSVPRTGLWYVMLTPG